MNERHRSEWFLMVVRRGAVTFIRVTDIFVTALNKCARAVLCWQGQRYKLSICKIKGQTDSNNVLIIMALLPLPTMQKCPKAAIKN